MQAKDYAYKAHKHMTRKGKTTPYTNHLDSVVEIVENLTTDKNIIEAAWLHDVLEDTITTIEDLKKYFNEKICKYVLLETENKNLDWEERKLNQISELKEENSNVIFIAFGDKLANLKEIKDDYNLIGESIWKRFNRGKEKQYWYYNEFYKLFKESGRIPKYYLKEYKELLKYLF